MLNIERKINEGERLSLCDYVAFAAVSTLLCASLFLLFYLACGVAAVLAG